MEIKIIGVKIVKGWQTLRQVANYTCAVERRTWCYNGIHLSACMEVRPVTAVKMDDGSWKLPPSTPNEAVFVCAEDGHGKGEITQSQCDCEDSSPPVFHAEVGKIPKGFCPDQILEAFGLARELEKNELLLLRRSVWSSNWSHSADVKVFKAGDIITENHLRDGHLLRPGNSIVLEHSKRGNNGYYSVKTRFMNQGGQLVRGDGAKDEKKAFARGIIGQLESEFGLATGEAVGVMKAAGPGASLAAAEYGKTLLATGHDPDILLVVLNQQGPEKTQLGQLRALRVLRLLQIETPKNLNSKNFFRVLQGARKFIHISVKRNRN